LVSIGSGLNLSGVSIPHNSTIKLPSITARELEEWQKTINAPTFTSSKKEENHLKKFMTKSALVITSLIAPGAFAPRILKKFPQIKKLLGPKLATFAVPVAVGLAAGTSLSLALQTFINGGIKKDNLISDLKDVLITSTMVSGFSNIISGSTRLINSYSILSHSKTLKRLAINGSIGSTYAFLRGIIKPEKDDKVSFERITKGFVEGMFLGEGARLLFSSRIGDSIRHYKFYNVLKYSKICLGAALGSMAFKLSDYFVTRVVKPEESKEPFSLKQESKKIVEHIFKGNSYPTILA
jgi:hypothetical protein